MNLTHTITQSLDWMDQITWQKTDTPFMDFRFWQALRATYAIGSDTLSNLSGWIENYVVIKMDDELLAVMPVFIKNHHRGEFVFDYAWAEAFAHYGFDYYPRLVTSVPYSPITGERFWLAEGIELTSEILQAAIEGVQALARSINASSWHGLYFDKRTVNLSHQQATTLLTRQGCQFQWFNQHVVEDNRKFHHFDDFLSTFTAKKRKNIRQERKKIVKQNLSVRRLLGDEITDEDWDRFYQCYTRTYIVRGQRPYLHPEFFLQLSATMPEHIMMVQGLNESGQVIASALFFYDSLNADTPMLYGRYWGALGEFDSLHFELCYYQGIEFAIEQGLKVFDPGTQGEHKLVRGFLPTVTHSIHQIYHAEFIPAIRDFCLAERQYMAEYRLQAFESLPFNVDNMPNFLNHCS